MAQKHVAPHDSPAIGVHVKVEGAVVDEARGERLRDRLVRLILVLRRMTEAVQAQFARTPQRYDAHYLNRR